MKNFLFSAFGFLLLGLFLSGCSSFVSIDRNVPEGAVVEGAKPLATFYVKNISYQIFGCIPWCTGVNWTEDDIPYEKTNGVHYEFFCDKVSLDNNIRTLKRACKDIGSNRIASLTHTVNEDNFWSFFLVNRKTLKTTCFILPKK